MTAKEEAIERFDYHADFFTASAVYAVLGWRLSLSWGTPEMMLGYARLAGLYGSIGCACSLAKKYLTQPQDMVSNI